MSMHIGAQNKSDIAESVLLPGDPLRAKFIAENFLQEPVCYNEIRGMLGFTGKYKGVPVSVQGSGMGMPSIGIYSWELIHEYDVQNLVRVGTAGSFQPDLKIRGVVLGLSASTDSNYVHTFNLNGQYAPTASWNLVQKALAAAQESKVEIAAGSVLSSDVFYEEDPDWWKKWADLGVLCVEMEAAALYMNAAAANVNALAMLTISDHFLTGEHASAEDRQESFTTMIELALKTVTA